MEKVMIIMCSSCGNWEEQPADASRHQVQGFEWVRNLEDGTAEYRCVNCGSTVQSEIVNRKREWVK